MIDGISSAAVNASATEFLIFSLLGGAIFAASTLFAFRFLARKRLMENTPTALIRSAAQGYLEFTGVAEAMDGPAVVSPLTLKPCAWYRYRVEQRTRHSGQQGNSWRTISSDESDDMFYLNDHTGRCVVNPDDAKIDTTHSRRWYGRHAQQPPASGSRFGIFGGDYRFTEERIDLGDSLYIIGEFITHGGAGGAAQTAEDVRELLRSWKRNRAQLLKRFDANNDGEIDQQEWETAMQSAEDEVAARSIAGDIPVVDVIAAPRDRRHPYLITTKSEDDLKRNYHYQSLALILLASCTAIALFISLSARLSAGA